MRGLVAKSPTEDLKKDVFQLAQRKAQRTFEERSRTHIVFCLEAGKFGTRGIGVFPEEAFANFKAAIEKLLEHATKDELEIWKDKLVSAEKTTMQPVRATADQDRDTPVAVHLVTSKCLHDIVKRESEKAKSLNQLSVEILEKTFDALDKAANVQPSEKIRTWIRQSDPDSNVESEQDKWIVRMAPKLRAQLAIFANEFGSSVPQVCKYLLSEHFCEQLKDAEKVRPAVRGR